MAFKKAMTIKGITADYWKIVDCDVKRGFVALALYVSKEAAAVRENMIGSRQTFDVLFPVDVTCPLAYAYQAIKAGVMVDVVQEDGTITQELKTNWFFDAEDL